VVAGATERWSLETVKREENGQKSSFVHKEEKGEKTCIVVNQINSPEEYSDSVLTQWEKEIEMLEKWLNHPKVGEDYQGEEVMKNSEENLQERQSPEEISEKEKQPVGSNNRNLQRVDYQGGEKELQKKNLSEDKLDKEIMELRGLMERSAKETREECNDKVGESLQARFGNQEKILQQQGNNNIKNKGKRQGDSSKLRFGT
jgi:hypothetical protein